MSNLQPPDYKSLLQRAGAPDLDDADLADLTPGLRAIDGKIAFLRELAAAMAGTLPSPIAAKDDQDV